MNDPLGLFEEDTTNDPLGLFGTGGIPDTAPESFYTPEQPSSLLDKAKGVGETLLNLGTGAVAMPSGFLGAAMQKLTSPNQTNFEQQTAANIGNLTYQPRTEAGKEYVENVGKVMNEAIPLMGIHGTIPSIKPGQAVAAARAALPERAPKIVGKSKAAALDAELTAKATDPLGLFEQGELFPETISDTTGHATPYEAGQAGVTSPITPLRARRQMELPMEEGVRGALAVDETGVPIRPEDRAGVEAFKAQEATKPSEPIPVEAQRDLFEPHTNMHRDFTDIRAATPEGGERPLTRGEFEQTIENLAKEPGTRYDRPADTDLAYKNYLEQVGGKQADLFDIGSRQEGFTKAASAEALTRAIDNHPFVKNAEKALAKQEKFVSDLQDQVKAGNTRATALVSEMRELEKAQEKVNTVRENVTTALKEKKTPSFNTKTRKQGGALFLGAGKKQALGTIKGNKALSEALPELVSVAETPEGVVKATTGLADVAVSTAKDAVRLFTKGFLYEKYKTNNPIVKYTYDKVSQAVDAAKETTHKLLQRDLLPKLRNMSTAEMTELHGAMLSAMKNKSDLSRAMLEKHGFNEKQIAAWESFQSAYKTSLDNMNTARAELGKPPVDAYAGYMAGMSTGDFRTTILGKDAAGNPTVVGIIGSNSKRAMESRVNDFLKTHPEYSKGTDKFYGGAGMRGDKGAALLEALSLLSDHNPDVKVFADSLAEHLQQQAYDYQGAKKHTMQKKGVFGMEGSKPWESAEQNALDGFHAQIRYVETMAKWSELSKAASDLKKVFSDPTIQESQKNAIAMSNEYLRNALGQNPSKVGRAIDGVVSSVGEALGYGPSYFDSAIRGVKGGINTVFFALRPMFIATNLLQGIVSTPKMVSFLRSRGIDIPHAIDVKSAINGVQHIWGNETPFSKAMWDYGEQHGISSTQIFDHSTDIRKGVGHYASKTLEAGMGIAEGVPRGMMYSMFANILKENGYAKHPDIFKVARELTDMSMGDYRLQEAQRANNVMGPLAPLLGNLSTFAGNENSMIALLAREAKTNKAYAPIVAAIGTGLAVHGLMGFPGFQEADWLYEKLTGWAGKPTTLTNQILNMAQDKGPAGDAMALGMPAYAGIDLHETLGRSSALPAMFGGGGAGKGIEIGKAGYAAITNPSEMNAKRLAYAAALGSMKGPMELSWFSHGDIALNRKEGHATEGLYKRSEFDKTARMAGVTSTSEYKSKEKIRQQMLEDIHYKDKQKSVLNSVGDKVVTKSGLQPDDITKALDKYIEAEGNPTTFAQEMLKYQVNVNTTAMQRYLLNKAKGGNLSAIKALGRMSEKEYGE